jgi:hypothetical protein
MLEEKPQRKNKEAYHDGLLRIVSLKKCVCLQVNDAVVSLRLVVFVSKVQGFYVQITEQTGWGRGERRRVPPL